MGKRVPSGYDGRNGENKTDCVFFKFDISLRMLMFSHGSENKCCIHNSSFSEISDQLFAANYIQPETAEAGKALFRDIYEGKEGGTAEIGLLDPNTLNYKKVRVRWEKIMDKSCEKAEAIGIIEPLHPEKNALTQQERKELSDLRIKSEIQSRYYQHLLKYQEQLRRFRHDRKNNLIVLSALINSGDIEGAKAYIASITAELAQMTPVVNTGNMAIDALVSEKIQEACNDGIKVDQMVGLSINPKIEMKDLCVAVGCCLDNAIEACRRAKERYPQTSILFRLIEKHGVITFQMENTSITPPQPDKKFLETSKEDKLNHGFGLKNIALVVQKYNGYFELIPQEGRFTTKFTLFPSM